MANAGMGFESGLAHAVRSATKRWKEAKKHAEREERRLSRAALERQRRQAGSIALSRTDAAYRVMVEAYLKASAGGTLPANARQIMYAARPLVLALTGGKWWTNDASFTQGALPDFVAAHLELTKDWDVVYDARGHFREPYGLASLGLGTIEVRTYIASWRQGAPRAASDLSQRIIAARKRVEDLSDLAPLDVPPTVLREPTRGPTNRYGAVLFVEKEGFDPHLERAGIAELFDIGIMSTKGMSVVACRALVDALSRAGVLICVLHDFDKSGFSILRTLREDTKRYRFSVPPRVVDLGLRLLDAQEMGLESEPVEYKKLKVDPRIDLRRSGATEEELAFLVDPRPGYGQWTGRRVELNAMDSAQFVAFVKRKLAAAGVRKMVPAAEVLNASYLGAMHRANEERARQHPEVLALQARAELRALEIAAEAPPVAAPPDLEERVTALLQGETVESWENVLTRVARQQLDQRDRTGWDDDE